MSVSYKERDINAKILNIKVIMKRFVLGILCCMYIPALFAQSATEIPGDYVYNQKNTPQGVDNYLFSTYYYNGKKAYNLRSLPLSTARGEVVSLKINPSGTSFALLARKGDNTLVSIHDLWIANRTLHEFKEVKNPSALCYTPDAKSLMIATPEEVLYFDARNYTLSDRMPMPFVAGKMVVSGNGYYLAATDGTRLTVWNMEQKSIRKEFEFDEPVNDMAFSADNGTFAVLTADGLLSTYDTRNFLILQSFDALGTASSCSFHPDGKYLSVVTGNTRIALLNLMDEQERSYVDNEDGSISDARFLCDGKKQIFLAYNTASSITYKLMSALAPNYTKLLAEELNERMNDWMKMMPGETLEEYQHRVNDETRAAQMRLFEQEIATRLADNLVAMSEVTLGSFNPESNLLEVNFNNMPTIYLNVPISDVNDFMDPGNLEFRNAKYGLTKQDKFELIYADVYNKASGKTYVFDNLDRQSLAYLQSDDNFVPLELVQQSNMEELKLREIKEKIVSLAKQEKTISDHTQISVDAGIVSDQDADGKKIMNYKINFAYEVENGFSAQEDFAPGKYKIEDSGAAQSMLAIIKTAFETDFAQYIRPGKKLQIRINGMADGLPVNGRIAYDGSYGEFVEEPVYKNDDLNNITVTKNEGITQNEQLAFLRAVGVREYIDGNIPSINTMNTNYRYNIEVTEGKGGKFRRITVEFVFVDAF